MFARESFTSSPKIIFEVISKSTSSHDYITKLAVYQKYGVLEYNIVEQSGKIIQYTLEDSTYTISDVYKNDDEYTSTAFPDLKINLRDIFDNKQKSYKSFINLTLIRLY